MQTWRDRPGCAGPLDAGAAGRDAGAVVEFPRVIVEGGGGAGDHRPLLRHGPSHRHAVEGGGGRLQRLRHGAVLLLLLLLLLLLVVVVVVVFCFYAACVTVVCPLRG